MLLYSARETFYNCLNVFNLVLSEYLPYLTIIRWKGKENCAMCSGLFVNIHWARGEFFHLLVLEIFFHFGNHCCSSTVFIWPHACIICCKIHSQPSRHRLENMPATAEVQLTSWWHMASYYHHSNQVVTNKLPCFSPLHLSEHMLTNSPQQYCNVFSVVQS